MKKFICMVLALVMVCCGCAAFAEEINVISREDGSGTRGAFIELFGIENVQYAIGPQIADGFYYDFDMPPLSREDLDAIEKEMKKVKLA